MSTDQKDVRQARFRRKNRQMIVMLIIPVAATIIVNVPFMTMNAYRIVNDNFELTPMNSVTTAI